LALIDELLPWTYPAASAPQHHPAALIAAIQATGATTSNPFTTPLEQAAPMQ
jgi:hypothetical protein